MKLVLKHEGELIEAEVERYGAGYRVRLGDRWIVADVHTANVFLKSLRLEDGRQFLLAHHSDKADHEVSFGDESVRLQVFDPLTVRRGSVEDAAHGAGTIRALMPGRVVRLLVEKGSSVAKGKGLLILEAMKMENEITAPRDGVVSDILVEAGQTVESGADLVILE